MSPRTFAQFTSGVVIFWLPVDFSEFISFPHELVSPISEGGGIFIEKETHSIVVVHVIVDLVVVVILLMRGSARVPSLTRSKGDSVLF